MLFKIDFQSNPPTIYDLHRRGPGWGINEQASRQSLFLPLFFFFFAGMETPDAPLSVHRVWQLFFKDEVVRLPNLEWKGKEPRKGSELERAALC